MPDELTCFACEQEPTQQCPRCGRPYCDDHGEDVCDACLEPASGLPSFTLYRGSLLALLIGTALAVWLILQPPGGNSDAALGPVIVTPTEETIELTTPTPDVTFGETPASDETPATSNETPEAADTPAPGGTTTYTVEAGDSLSAICANLSSLPLQDCIDRVVELNASVDDPADIVPGEELVVPQ